MTADAEPAPRTGALLARFAPGALAGVAAPAGVTVLGSLDLAVGRDEGDLRALRPGTVIDARPLLAVGPAARRLVTALDRAAWFIDLQRRRPPPPSAHLLAGRLPGDDGGYPALDPAGLLEADPGLDGAATEPAVIPAVSLSLGPGAGHPVDEGDPVRAATRSLARRALVVMAAGNDGEGPGGVATTSAWARAPWALAVGSAVVDDRDGRVELAESSSRGVAADPRSGPFVIADGRSGVDPRRFGTSFAAPRVAGFAVQICAAVLQLLRVLRRGDGDGAGAPALGVPVVAPLLVDTFSGGTWYPGPPRLPLRALPLCGPGEACARVREHLAPAGSAGPALRAGADVLARVLAAAARPVPGRGSHQVGHGYVDREGVIGALSRITAGGWLTLLGAAGHVPRLPAPLAGAPLLERAGVRALWAVVDASMPVVMIDRTTYETAVRADDPAGWAGRRCVAPRATG